MSVHKQGKKNRKLGRNEKKCQLYKALNKREYAKYRRIKKYNPIEAIEYAKKHNLSI